MSYQDFVQEALPLVLDLKLQCQKMTQEEFERYKERAQKLAKNQDVSYEFVRRCFK